MLPTLSARKACGGVTGPGCMNGRSSATSGYVGHQLAEQRAAGQQAAFHQCLTQNEDADGKPITSQAACGDTLPVSMITRAPASTMCHISSRRGPKCRKAISMRTAARVQRGRSHRRQNSGASQSGLRAAKCGHAPPGKPAQASGTRQVLLPTREAIQSGAKWRVGNRKKSSFGD